MEMWIHNKISNHFSSLPDMYNLSSGSTYYHWFQYDAHDYYLLLLIMVIHHLLRIVNAFIGCGCIPHIILH